MKTQKLKALKADIKKQTKAVTHATRGVEKALKLKTKAEEKLAKLQAKLPVEAIPTETTPAAISA